MKILLTIWIALLSFNLCNAQSTEEYILEKAELAQSLMKENNVPASIILAVAIHESAAGKSKIAKYLNNHFGIKGLNQNREIKSSYKSYQDVHESYQHFIEILKTRSTFSKIFDKHDQYDYQGWAKAIHRSGYATSKLWSSQVIALIKKYQLYEYDDRPEDYIEPVYKSTPILSKKSTYTVRKGDNLSSIAKKMRTTVTALKMKNNLKSNAIKPGQKLKT